MSKRFPVERFTLPIVINPPKTRCYLVRVPDDIYHIAAFKGSILKLGRAFSWANDAAHTAKLAAAVWMAIFNGLEESDCTDDCTVLSAETGDEYMIRLNGCKLESSVDGTHWCEWGDISSCIGGSIGTPGGKGPGGYTPGEKVDGCFTLAGRDLFWLNVPLDEGDTISVDGLSGGWSDDGGAFSTWNCPDGSIFTLGQCGGVASPNPGGVDTAAYYGELMLNINGTWYRPTQGVVTVPSGVHSAQAWLQMNDTDLTNNQGTISFCTHITKNPLLTNTWQHYFDFTTGQHGWEANVGTYAPGVGFQTADNAISGGFERSVYIKLTTNIKPMSMIYYQMVFSATFGNFALGGAALCPEFIEAPLATIIASHTPAAGDTNIVYSGSAIVDPTNLYGKVFADQQVTAPALLGQATIIGARLKGNGAIDPYASY
jgi:hypothetical protein